MMSVCTEPCGGFLWGSLIILPDETPISTWRDGILTCLFMFSTLFPWEASLTSHGSDFSPGIVHVGECFKAGSIPLHLLKMPPCPVGGKS